MKTSTRMAVLSMALTLPLVPQAQGDLRVPVPLNHFFVVVPSDAYEAIKTSEFMTRTFAPFEARTTARNDQTYTGIYFYGRKTYFEFFEPEAQGPVGASGIALGVDEGGQISLIEAAWKKALGGAERGAVTRKTETDEPPWFEMVAGAGQGPGLRLWFMEYAKGFLARWYPSLTAARGVTRAEVLDRYVAKIGRSADRETALLGDVIGLDLGLDGTDRTALLGHLGASGWTVVVDGTGNAVAEGPEGVRIRVEPKTGAGGIIGIDFALQRSVPKESHRFGSSVTLTLEGERARLRTGGRP